MSSMSSTIPPLKFLSAVLAVASLVSAHVEATLLAPAPTPAPALVPTPLYIFGDSTLDVGTNNLVPGCGARANFSFNGIDFPSGPTGRFSNGYNIADEIAKKMGYKMSPPSYLSLLQDNATFPRNILVGANFASGGSGILNATGQHRYGKVISLEDQIQQFSSVRDSIVNTTGCDRIISKALFLISVGSNDIFDYPQGTSSLDYLATLQSEYQKHLQRLYDLGARKFGILSVPPVGCCPVSRSLTGNGTCLAEANATAEAFNSEVQEFFKNFSRQFKDINFSLANMYALTSDMILNPTAYGKGFENVESACCGNANYPCNRTASLCGNRDVFLFWDRFHPTQAASELVAATAFEGSTKFVTPINFSQLLKGN